MECNIVEKPAEKIECDVIEAEIEPPEIPEIPAPEPYEICKSVAKPVEREVCRDVKMKGFTEKCSEVPVGVPSVDCGSQMMPLSLKNICVKIDFKLPRQECETETRQDCRYNPKNSNLNFRVKNEVVCRFKIRWISGAKS